MSTNHTAGLPVSALAAALHFVPVSVGKRPDIWQTPGDRLSPEKWRRIAGILGYRDTSRLPLSILGRTSFETLCRVRLSSPVMMAPSVESLFEASPPHRLIAKIQNSIWRCSYVRAQWNDIVHAWNGLKSFSLDTKDFSVTIDHTPSCNMNGFATYSETYLDGCLAFLIHYKSVHVLTVSFSLASGRRLLIRQVQAARRSGNRWLFKLPQNYLMFLAFRLSKAFPKHTLHVVSGNDLVDRILANYQSSVDRWTQRAEGNQRGDAAIFRDETIKKIDHLRVERSRIVEFYKTIIDPSAQSVTTIQGLRHFRVGLEGKAFHQEPKDSSGDRADYRKAIIQQAG